MIDRISLCEGYWQYYSDWHLGGLTRRCNATGRGIAVQLDRLRFRPSPLLTTERLSDEAREVYLALVERWEKPHMKHEPLSKIEPGADVCGGPNVGCEECGLGDIPAPADLDDPKIHERYEQAQDGHFSWSECEGCGSPLGGQRYPAHQRDGDEWLHLDLCVDCYFTLEGLPLEEDE
jgi:hypothetical protein